jgi:mRNA interferase MazF
MQISPYDIVLVNLDPTVGSEIRKTRPCVVISPDEINHNLSTIVIAPMTSKSRNYPTRVKVMHNNTEGFVVIDQIRTIDKKRIVKRFDTLHPAEIKMVKEIIKETFVD